jgi:ferric-dicitrate binding protein FerR (iron transport regulator)
MTCSRYTPMLSRFLDRELTVSETAEVESHLVRCVDCRALLEHWHRQGERLRSHLARHAPGEEFVQRVVQTATSQRRDDGVAAVQSVRRRSAFRWFPLAAAILAGITILSLVFPGRGDIGYARVIDPGESLEVLTSDSVSWVRTAAGEILRPGDWVRSSRSGSAEVLWRDSYRLTLESGTLAQIPESALQPADQLFLARGVVLSEVQGNEREFHVNTPAGTVDASGGRFVVRVGDLMLPTLEIGSDRSERLRGEVVPFTSLSVMEGHVKVQVSNTTREVQSGQTAVFGESRFVCSSSASEPVEASLRLQPISGGNATLSASLATSAAGLRLEYRAADISLTRLLESATGVEVRGGEDVAVAGSLFFAPGTSPQDIASAVSTALAVPIAFRQEKAHLAIASAPRNHAPASINYHGRYSFEKSPNGAISFDFQAIPASRAFSVLRSAANGMPELSVESECFPINLHTSSLAPADASTWIVRALGMEVETGDCQIGILDVGSPAAISGGNQMEAANLGDRLGVPEEVIGGRAQAGITAAASGVVRLNDAPLPGKNRLTAASASQTSDSMMSLTPTDTSSAISAPGLCPSAGPAAHAASTATGKASSQKREYFGAAVSKPAPSTHLIWPPLGTEDNPGEEVMYLISNSMGLPARTLWQGYDAQGQLAAQYSLVVERSSSLELVVHRDLPTDLGQDGHWETTSDIPVIGSRDKVTSAGVGLGLPVESERVPWQWSLPAWWLTEFGGRFWLANPEGEQDVVVFTLVQGGRILSAEQVTIPAHGALIWPDPFSTIDFTPAAAGLGVTLEIHTLLGRVAAGLSR